jgi:hypothetical protein
VKEINESERAGLGEENKNPKQTDFISKQIRTYARGQTLKSDKTILVRVHTLCSR